MSININDSDISQKNEGGGDNIIGNKYVTYIINGVERNIPQFLTNYSLRETFIGRTEELQAIQTNLSQNKQVVLVNGLGGIGKTSLAKEYLKLNHQNYQHIVWLEQTSTLVNAFILDDILLANLGLKFSNEEEAYKFKKIINTLANLQGNNLLVIDNYTEKTEDIELQTLQKFPFAHNWQIIMTSREKIAKFVPINLSALSELEAIALFKTYCISKAIDETELKVLLATIDYHTLTIELLAKNYELSWDLKNIAELTQLLQTQAIDAQELQENVFTEHSQMEVQMYSYLVSIFNMANLDGKAIWLLKQLAVLPPLSIEGKILLKWVGGNFKKQKLNFLQKVFPFAFPKIKSKLNKVILLDLVKKGWLISTDNQYFEMHRLIQTLIVKTQEPKYADCEKLFEQIIKLLNYKSNEKKAIEKLGVIEYGENFLQKLNFTQAEAKKSYLQNNLALTYEVFGQYEKARDLLELALASDLNNFGKDHPTVARTQSNLATMYFYLGQYEKALDLLELALASDLSNFGKDHPTVAVRQSSLATVYQSLGQYEKARDLLKLALASDLSNFGKDHPTVTCIQSNLAIVYQDLGQYEKARDLLELALNSAVSNFGANYPNVAVRQSNLASVYSDLGQYEKARDLLELALALAVSNFGKDHPTVTRIQSNLASVYSNLGQYEKARDLLETSLAFDLQNFGEAHPNIAVSQSYLANVYFNLGQYEKARNLFELALASDLSNFGKDHPNVAVRQYNLANVYFNLANIEIEKKNKELAIQHIQKSISLGESAYQIYQTNLGDNHQHTKLFKRDLDYFKNYLENL
jgi:tetratricopeptide (TPR) repeat protein